MQDKILHPNIQLLFFHLGDVAPKNGPKVKKSGWNNASLPRATTEILSPEVRPRGGASEKGVLT